MKYAWMQTHCSMFSLTAMANVLGVSCSGYYAWLQRSPSAREQENQRLRTLIKQHFIASHATYSSRRIRRALQQAGEQISRRRVRQLMKSEGLCCKTKRKFRLTTNSAHPHPVAPNHLNRDFQAISPNEKYVGDITYIWTNEGWLYLAVVIDLFSRQVVGWSMAAHMRTELVNQALLMAVWARKPRHGLIWHTDRGVQYASDSHRALLRAHGIIQSMSRKGNCWDNAVAESFFHTLKTEFVHHMQFKTREEAKDAIVKYIEIFYNRKRLHSANDYMAPVAFEEARAAA